MSKLEKLLKESNLSPEAKKLVMEAWDEEKRNVAADIRLELTERYEADKAGLVEGLANMTTAVINEEMANIRDERKKLSEDRVRIRASLANFSKFSNGILAEEVSKIRKDRRELSESMAKFMQFSNRIIAEELTEFHIDRKRLVETRVRLITHGKRKIDEARKAFVARAASEAAEYIKECTERELTELRVQLHEAKRNMFGRKIFEAFANEFMQTQYRNDPVLRDLRGTVRTLTNKILESQQSEAVLLEEKNKLQRKLQIVEERSVRNGMIAEMVKPLTTSQKTIMGNLLEMTPTNRLKEDFNKYLPTVLSESKGIVPRTAPKKQAPINESVVDKTGNRTAQSVQDDEFDDELNDLARFAGIR